MLRISISCLDLGTYPSFSRFSCVGLKIEPSSSSSSSGGAMRRMTMTNDNEDYPNSLLASDPRPRPRPRPHLLLLLLLLLRIALSFSCVGLNLFSISSVLRNFTPMPSLLPFFSLSLSRNGTFPLSSSHVRTPAVMDWFRAVGLGLQDHVNRKNRNRVCVLCCVLSDETRVIEEEKRK